MARCKESGFYTTARWRRVRHRVLVRDEGLCVKCRRNFILKIAECVDHIKPIADGGAEYKMANLQSLCWSCHSAKTARQSASDAVGSCIHGYPIGSCCDN